MLEASNGNVSKHENTLKHQNILKQVFLIKNNKTAGECINTLVPRVNKIIKHTLNWLNIPAFDYLVDTAEAYLEPSRTSTEMPFYGNNYRLLTANYFRKKVPL